MKKNNYRKSDINFLIEEFSRITETKKHISPSEYIEEVRFLPKGLTPKSGYYDYNYTPYLREIIDCFDISSPIRKIVVLKSAQIGATVGLIESAILYHIGCLPMPQLMVTADKNLAEKTMIARIEPMLEYSNLNHLIMAQSNSKHRTGSTKLSKEYINGYLHLIGAKNPDAFRGMTYPRMYLDEIDTYSSNMGDEGNAVSLVDNRTNAFAQTRKILYTGTPLIEQTSQIWYLFQQGNQKYYEVPCPYCKKYQNLLWHGKTDDGKEFGIVFELDKDFLPVEDTIGYKCKHCGETIYNHHKTDMLSQGKWVATSRSREPGLVSYSINSLYSPVGMLSWTNIVYEWLKCWDVERNRVKDIDKFKEFYNTKLGRPFHQKGEQIKREKVQQYRNYKYIKNQINNIDAKKDSGSEILFLTCAVDVQKNNLWVHVIGWCNRGINYTIDFFSIDGMTENYNAETWKKLDVLLADQTWQSDDNKEYRIIHTNIDSGHYTDYVYHFCNTYSKGVFSIKGDDFINGGLTYKQFNRTTLEKAGLNTAYHINTTKNKDKLAKMFNLNWETGKLQPDWYVNFPVDMHDDVFDMFESEHKVNEYDKITNKWLRSRWRLVPGRENAAFDTFCYNLAGLEMVADYICRDYIGINYLNWEKFWSWCSENHFYKEIK